MKLGYPACRTGAGRYNFRNVHVIVDVGFLDGRPVFAEPDGFSFGHGAYAVTRSRRTGRAGQCHRPRSRRRQATP